jgi:hypothetical protein
MKKLMIILCFTTMLFPQISDQKMIVSIDEKAVSAASTLDELETFFEQNLEAKVLKKEENLMLTTEHLEHYFLTVVKPIKTIALKNHLKTLLKTKYLDAFFVQNTHKDMEKIASTVLIEKTKEKIDNKMLSKREKSKDITVEDLFNIVNKSISKEWLALLILAIVGLLLVYRSTRQITKIKKLQETLEIYQEKVEGQMDQIGEQL